MVTKQNVESKSAIVFPASNIELLYGISTTVVVKKSKFWMRTPIESENTFPENVTLTVTVYGNTLQLVLTGKSVTLNI